MSSRCQAAPRCPGRPTPGDGLESWWDQHAISFCLALVLLGLTVARAWVVVHVDAGLHVDEAQYWAWSKALDWGYYSKPPMIAALIAASTSLLGDGLLGVKALAMLCYPLTAWVLYRWVGEVTGDIATHHSAGPERAGLIAALMFIVSPVAGLLGLAATTDAPLLLAWSLAARALWRAWRDGRRRDWLQLGLWLGVGVMSKYTMAAFALSALGFLLTQPRGPVERAGGRFAQLVAQLARPLRGFGLAGMVALLCVAPNLAWNAQHDWPTLRHTAEITVGAKSEPVLRTMGQYLGGLALLAGPVLVAWAAWWRTSLGRDTRAQVRRCPNDAWPSRSGVTRAEAWWFAAWLSGPLLLIGAAQSLHARAQVNWTAPALIGAALALALWLRPEQPQRRLRGWLLALAGQALLIGALTLGSDVAHLLHQPLPRKLDVWARMRGWDRAFQDLRPAADAYWREQAATGQAPVVLGSERAVLANGAYAWRTQPPQWRAWRQDQHVPHNHFELVAPLQPADHPQSLLIVSEGPLQPPLLQALGATPRRLAAAEVEQTPGRPLRLELWQAELAAQPVVAQGKQATVSR